MSDPAVSLSPSRFSFTGQEGIPRGLTLANSQVGQRRLVKEVLDAFGLHYFIAIHRLITHPKVIPLFTSARTRVVEAIHRLSIGVFDQIVAREKARPGVSSAPNVDDFIKGEVYLLSHAPMPEYGDLWRLSMGNRENLKAEYVADWKARIGQTILELLVLLDNERVLDADEIFMFEQVIYRVAAFEGWTYYDLIRYWLAHIAQGNPPAWIGNLTLAPGMKESDFGEKFATLNSLGLQRGTSFKTFLYDISIRLLEQKTGPLPAHFQEQLRNLWEDESQRRLVMLLISQPNFLDLDLSKLDPEAAKRLLIKMQYVMRAQSLWRERTPDAFINLCYSGNDDLNRHPLDSSITAEHATTASEIALRVAPTDLTFSLFYELLLFKGDLPIVRDLSLRTPPLKGSAFMKAAKYWLQYPEIRTVPDFWEWITKAPDLPPLDNPHQKNLNTALLKAAGVAIPENRRIHFLALMLRLNDEAGLAQFILKGEQLGLNTWEFIYALSRSGIDPLSFVIPTQWITRIVNTILPRFTAISLLRPKFWLCLFQFQSPPPEDKWAAFLARFNGIREIDLDPLFFALLFQCLGLTPSTNPLAKCHEPGTTQKERTAIIQKLLLIFRACYPGSLRRYIAHGETLSEWKEIQKRYGDFIQAFASGRFDRELKAYAQGPANRASLADYVMERLNSLKILGVPEEALLFYLLNGGDTGQIPLDFVSELIDQASPPIERFLQGVDGNPPLRDLEELAAIENYIYGITGALNFTYYDLLLYWLQLNAQEAVFKPVTLIVGLEHTGIVKEEATSRFTQIGLFGIQKGTSFREFLYRLSIHLIERKLGPLSDLAKEKLRRLWQKSESGRRLMLLLLFRDDFAALPLNKFPDSEAIEMLELIQFSFRTQDKLGIRIPQLADWIILASNDDLVSLAALPQIPEARLQMAVALLNSIEISPRRGLRCLISLITLPIPPSNAPVPSFIKGGYLDYATFQRMRSLSPAFPLDQLESIQMLLHQGGPVANQIVFLSGGERPDHLNLQDTPDARTTFLLMEMEEFLGLKGCPQASLIVRHLLTDNKRRSFPSMQAGELAKRLLQFEELVEHIKITDTGLLLIIFTLFIDKIKSEMGFVELIQEIKQLTPIDDNFCKKCLVRYPKGLDFRPYQDVVKRVEQFMLHFSITCRPGMGFWIQILDLKTWPIEEDDARFIQDLKHLINPDSDGVGTNVVADDPAMLQIFYKHLAGLITASHMGLLSRIGQRYPLTWEDVIDILLVRDSHYNASTETDLLARDFDAQMEFLVRRFGLLQPEAGTIVFKYLPTGLRHLKEEISALEYVERITGIRLTSGVTFSFLLCQLPIAIFRDFAMNLAKFQAEIQPYLRKFLIPRDLMNEYYRFGNELVPRHGPSNNKEQRALVTLMSLLTHETTISIANPPWIEHMHWDAIVGLPYHIGEDPPVYCRPNEMTLLSPSLRNNHGKKLSAHWSPPGQDEKGPLFTLIVSNETTGAAEIIHSRLEIPYSLLKLDHDIMAILAQQDAWLVKQLPELDAKEIINQKETFIRHVENSLGSALAHIASLRISGPLKNQWIQFVTANRRAVIGHLRKHTEPTNPSNPVSASEIDTTVKLITLSSTSITQFILQVGRILSNEITDCKGEEPKSLEDCRRLYTTRDPLQSLDFLLQNYSTPPGIERAGLFKRVFEFIKKMKIDYRIAVQSTSAPDRIPPIDEFLAPSDSIRIYPTDAGFSLDNPKRSSLSSLPRSIGHQYDAELTEMCRIINGQAKGCKTFSLDEGVLEFNFDPEMAAVTMQLKSPPQLDEGVRFSSLTRHNEASLTIRYGTFGPNVLSLMKRHLLMVIAKLQENL